VNCRSSCRRWSGVVKQGHQITCQRAGANGGLGRPSSSEPILEGSGAGANKIESFPALSDLGAGSYATDLPGLEFGTADGSLTRSALASHSTDIGNARSTLSWIMLRREFDPPHLQTSHDLHTTPHDLHGIPRRLLVSHPGSIWGFIILTHLWPGGNIRDKVSEAL